MSNALVVIAVAALLCGGVALWVLHAYRHAAGREPVNPAPAVGACAAAAVAAFLMYLVIGQPTLADAPFAARLEALQDRDPLSLNADEALAILSHRARTAPRDPLPHFYSGQVLLSSDRPQEAARAYDAALRRDPNMTDAMLGLGRALVEVDQGRVSPQALELFERVGAESADPAPWIYQAMAAMQDGRESDARGHWRQALSRMGPDDPRREMADRMSRGAGR